MICQSTCKKSINKIFADIIFSLVFSLILLLSSCKSSKDEVGKSPQVIANQVKDAVLEAEKKSNDPITWPTITNQVVIGNYALVRYRYKSNISSEMILVQKMNKWSKIFASDSISLNTMKKMSVPPQIATELFKKIN
jgi:activator of 2-hydroxyglutaryl-CoA dehydratase